MPPTSASSFASHRQSPSPSSQITQPRSDPLPVSDHTATPALAGLRHMQANIHPSSPDGSSQVSDSLPFFTVTTSSPVVLMTRFRVSDFLSIALVRSSNSVVLMAHSRFSQYLPFTFATTSSPVVPMGPKSPTVSLLPSSHLYPVSLRWLLQKVNDCYFRLSCKSLPSRSDGFLRKSPTATSDFRALPSRSPDGFLRKSPTATSDFRVKSFPSRSDGSSESLRLLLPTKILEPPFEPPPKPNAPSSAMPPHAKAPSVASSCKL
jgi:hypothetical protein